MEEFGGVSSGLLFGKSARDGGSRAVVLGSVAWCLAAARILLEIRFFFLLGFRNRKQAAGC